MTLHGPDGDVGARTVAAAHETAPVTGDPMGDPRLLACDAELARLSQFRNVTNLGRGQ